MLRELNSDVGDPAWPGLALWEHNMVIRTRDRYIYLRSDVRTRTGLILLHGKIECGSSCGSTAYAYNDTGTIPR